MPQDPAAPEPQHFCHGPLATYANAVGVGIVFGGTEWHLEDAEGDFSVMVEYCPWCGEKLSDPVKLEQ